MKKLISGIFILALASACPSKDSKPTDEPATPPPTQATAPTAAADAAVEASDDLPTPEDFEGEAAESINSKTLKADLEKLEKEIGVNE